MSYMRPAIEAMTGYVPGEQPQAGDWVKLNTNENPYPPSPAVGPALAAAAERARLYPDPVSRELRAAAGEVWGLPPEQILAGNGSDDVLNLLIRATASEGQTVASFAPSYTLYATLAQIQGAAYREYDLTETFAVPDDLYLDGVRVLFLANPNAPSGTAVDLAAVERLAGQCPGLLVVDEAYVDFAAAGTTALPLLGRCPNLVVTRTLSKSYSLAGARVGFACAAPAIIEQLLKVKDSYNLDAFAQAAGTAALRDQETLRRNTERLVATRQRLTFELEKLGFEVEPSQTNFVLVSVGSAPAARALFGELKERRILVRYFDAPRLADCLRITVGTDEEVDRLLEALRELQRAA
jgi:histidinol-phosphate aminotransferase